MQPLLQVREYYIELYSALSSPHFTSMQWHDPPDAAWRRIFYLDLWEESMRTNATGSQHAIALRIPEECLLDALDLAVFHHSERCIVMLFSRLKRGNYAEVALLGAIQCSGKNCVECAFIRRRIVQDYSETFLLEKDYEFVRRAMISARKRNLWIMHVPLLYNSPKTDAIFRKIAKKTSENWSLLVATVFLRIAWNRWVLRRLEPGSKYLKKISEKWQATLPI